MGTATAMKPTTITTTMITAETAQDRRPLVSGQYGAAQASSPPSSCKVECTAP